MKMFTVLLVFVSLLVILTNSNVMAQQGSGKIQGKVTDATTGEPLFGANAVIVGTSLGAATGIDGEYQITNVPAGTYEIQFTYIGYKSFKAENVKVSSGKTTIHNIKLTIESVAGETVVVTAQKQGQIAAINQQLSSNVIKDIVAKDWIQEVPDKNAAESIGRLPGVSIQRDGGEGNKIVVRGLSPKYNNIEIEGVPLTGIETDRSVGLSIISSEMLEGIELTKSLTPDKDADALGGTVNLTLKEADEGLHFNASAYGSYNKLRTDYGNFKFSARVSDRFFDNKLGIIANFGTEKVNRSSNNFNAAYNKILSQQDVLQTSYAHVIQNLDERYRSFGNIVLDYKTDFMKLKMNNMLSQQKDENTNRDNSFNFVGSEFDFSIYKSKPITTIRSHSLSGVFSFLNTELKLDASYSRSTYADYRDQYNFLDNYIMKGTTISSAALISAQPASLINQYYDITQPKTSILYQNYMTSTNRKDETYTYNADWKIPYRISQFISGSIKVGGKFSDKNRNSNVLQLEGAYYGGRGIQFVENVEKIKLVPGLITNVDAGIPRSEGFPALNWTENYDWGNMFDGKYRLGYSENMDKLDAFSHIIYNYNPYFIILNGQQTYQDDYINREKEGAGYVMTEMRIGESLIVIPGVRYEKMHSSYSSYFIQVEGESITGVKYIKPVTAIADNEAWFPSVNAKYNVNSWSDVRAAYYRSATRPDYRLLSPAVVADEGKINLTAYNPYLKPALAHNFDLIYSVHTNELGLFSIDGFYKEISDLITQIPTYQPMYFDKVQNAPAELIAELMAPRKLYDPTLFKTSGQTMNNFPINNPELTYFRGIELNWETNFWYLPGLLSNLVLDVNYSRIWSTTQVPYLTILNIPDPVKHIPIATPFYKTRSSRMYDQPSDILNVRVGWDYEGFSTRVSLRYQGEVLTGLDPVNSLTDSYNKSIVMIDLNMKQELYKNLSLQFDVTNLTNYMDDSYYTTRYGSFPTNTVSYGLEAQIGIKYEY